MDHDDTAPACCVCHRELYDDEQQTCRLCSERVELNLRAIAGPEGLYAQLSQSLHPGAGMAGPNVSGSRTAPLPVRLDPLSLAARGGVVTVLQTWLVDWHETLGYRHPRWEGDLQQQCDQVVHRLRVLLPWAAEQHGAFNEFASELARLKTQCETATGSEKPARRVPVTCTCGHVLRITIDTAGVRCPACSTQYGHSEALRLPLAERRAA